MLPKMSENYTDIKARIQAACLKLSELEKPDIAAIARKHSIPEQGLRARAAGRPSRSQRIVGNYYPSGNSLDNYARGICHHGGEHISEPKLPE